MGHLHRDARLTAAVMLATWAEGFAAIEAAQALADAGLAPRRRYFVVLDELWRPLRIGAGLTDRLDDITRLNRTLGIGQLMLTHTLRDMESMASEADRVKARGFVERAGAVVVGGLPSQELDDLSHVVPFTRSERDLITSWSTPPSWDDRQGPPGMGNFLIKIGRRPGVPVHLDLTRAELTAGVHDTNKRWMTTNGSTRLTLDPAAVTALPEPQVLRLPEPAGPLLIDLHAADLRGADHPAAAGAVDLDKTGPTSGPAAAPTQRAGD